MSSGNSRFRKGREKILVGSAKENGEIFQMMLWNRSAEKFDGGMRTRVKDSPTETLYQWAKDIAKKDDFLVSTYIGGEFLVITTKKRQWGYCTADTPYAESLAKHHEKMARTCLMELGPDGAKSVELSLEPERSSIVGLTGSVFNFNGQVAGSVGGIPPGIDSTPWEITHLEPASEWFPAWADASVGSTAVRINPEIIKAPYHRLFDCFAFVSVNHECIPGLAEKTMAQMTFQGEDFVFWKEKLSNGTIVMIDTARRIKEFNANSLPDIPSAPRMFSEGQHWIGPKPSKN